MAIWVWLVLTGLISVIEAIVLTVLVTAALITGLIMAIRARTTRLPPEAHPPL